MKIKLIIPLQLPSKNITTGKNWRKVYALRNKWHSTVQVALLSQVSRDTLKYFKDRLGAEGVTYHFIITARLIREYDDDNLFAKHVIDAFKGILIKDDSKKYLPEPAIIQQEKIDCFGKRMGKQTWYYDRVTGMRVFPETIVEITIFERQEQLL
jgi:hypothetical protein